jgi:hypothetical protein
MSVARTTVQPIYLRMSPADIALVKFLFESYEEVGLVRTVDRHAAIVVLLVAPDFVATARAVLDDLHLLIGFREIDPPIDGADDWLMRAIEEEE